MTEREAQSAPSLIPTELPTKTVEIKTKAQELARNLINDSTLIPELFKVAENYGLSEDPAIYREKRGQMTGFLSAVGKEIDTFNWPKKIDDKLSHAAGRSLLLYLRPLDQKSRPTKQQEIVEKIANGWINKRFEKKPVNDWRKATLGLKDFLENAVLPEADLGVLTNWFNLMTGKYPDVMARYTSVAWRAFHSSARAASPYDESILADNSELQKSLSLTSELLNRRAEHKENSRSYMGMTLQFTALLVLLDERVDPFTKNGLISYRKTMEQSAKRQGFILNKSMYQEIPLDVLEVLESASMYPDRFIKLMRVIDQFYYAGQKKTTFLTSGDYKRKPEGGYEFPYNIYFKSSPAVEALQALVDTTTIKQSLYEIAQQMAIERGERKPIPFSIQGLQGYVILDHTGGLSPKDLVKRIAELIDTHDVKNLWKQIAQTLPPGSPSASIDFPDCAFKLITKEYLPKSGLASLLDLKIPDEALRKVNETFASSLSLERSITQNFTRMPTLTGDKYTLVDHPDLPDVIESAVVRKTPGGGLGYILTFVTDPLIFPDGEKPVSAGTVNFKFGMVNITPDENFSSLPVDQRWILKSAILRLIERSCCPTLKEIEEEMKEYEKNGGINYQSIPGYIGHVGGFRATGERKQYTRGAEENFTTVVGDLFDETKGISLGRLNEKHRQEDPRDDRFLTYYKGRETNQPQEPKPRKNPDKLLPVELY